MAIKNKRGTKPATQDRHHEDGEAPERDPFLNPWRSPHSEGARALVANAVALVEAHEERHGLRKRRRRPGDQRTFEATVGAVVSDLVYRALLSEPQWVAVTRSNQKLGAKSRYRPRAFSKTFPVILDRLAKVGLIRQRLGQQRSAFGPGKWTTIAPSADLLKDAQRRGLAVEDFGPDKHAEIIELRAAKEDRRKAGPQSEYDDTTFTRQARSDLRAINEWLAGADINFDEAVLDADELVDVRDRRLRRIFTNGSFKSGGRLTGGWWQNLSRGKRLAGTTIEDRPVAYLDYGQTTARIAYGYVGAVPRLRDLYKVPGLELWRDGVKKLLSALLFADRPLTRKPQHTAKLLPNRTIGELKDAIQQAHAPIADLFEQGIGHRLQFHESEVLVALLLRLRDPNIVALPVHDAVIVRKDRRSQTAAVMKDVFKEKIGVEASVGVEVG